MTTETLAMTYVDEAVASVAVVDDADNGEVVVVAVVVVIDAADKHAAPVADVGVFVVVAVAVVEVAVAFVVQELCTVDSPDLLLIDIFCT